MVLRREVDGAIELLHDHLTDHETETNSLCVYSLLLVDVRAEELEDLVMVIFLYSMAVVFHRYTQLRRSLLTIRLLMTLILVLFGHLNQDVDFTILISELEGI